MLWDKGVWFLCFVILANVVGMLNLFVLKLVVLRTVLA